MSEHRELRYGFDRPLRPDWRDLACVLSALVAIPASEQWKWPRRCRFQLE
ncbi:hypothetical protein [uncultured Mycobacterium sp.]